MGRRLAAAAALWVATACSADKPDAAARCRAEFAASRWGSAASICLEAGKKTNDPSLLLTAGWSLYYEARADEALAIAEELFASPSRAYALQLAATVRRDRGELEAARSLWDEALTTHASAGQHREAAFAAYQLAISYLEEGSFVEALNAALRCRAEAELTKDRQMRGFADLALAQAYLALGDDHTARELYEHANAHLDESARDLAWLPFKYGMLLLTVGSTNAATRKFETALKLARDHGIDELVTAAHLNLAYAERLRGNLDAAEAHLRALHDIDDDPMLAFVSGMLASDRGRLTEAEALLATAAERAPNKEYAWDIAHHRAVVAERAHDFAPAEARYREAIALVESLRARVPTIDQRAHMLAQRKKPFGALFALLVRQARVVDALEIAEALHARSWFDAVVAAERSTEPITPAEVARLGSVRQGLTIPATSSLDGRTLMRLIRDEEVLSFFAADDRFWRIHVVDGQVTIDELRDPTELLDRFWSAPSDAAVAEELGRLLIPDGVAPSTRPLYVVAGDSLATLPFPALRRGGRYLVESRPVVRLPSLAALRCAPRQSTGAGVVVADAQNDLAFARAEGVRVADALAAAVHLGEAATIDAVTSGRAAPFIHLAVHGEVGRSGGALRLADGALTTGEIIQRRLAPDLVVLAGCATGISPDREGSGAVAMAFLAAGAGTVVATLQSLPDRDLAPLTERFYAYGGHRDPVTALTRAQRDLARTSPTMSWAFVSVFGACSPNRVQKISPAVHAN